MITWLQRQIRDHFGFSKAETNGVFLLLLLSIGFLAVPQALRWYYIKHPPANNNADIALLDHVIAQLEQQHQAHKHRTPLPNKGKSSFSPTNKKQAKKREVKKIQAFDINTADTSQLQHIQGIGPVLSTRIIKFRDQLGGFVDKSQYAAVYGLTPSVLEQLVAYTYIADGFVPQQLNINTAAFKSLVAHPYLNYQQVQRIIQHKEKKGHFVSLQDLLSFAILNESTFKKIKPYLKVTE